MYDFNEQLTKGEGAERTLDTLFAQWYAIQPVDREQQRRGIDRIFTRKDNGCIFRIEYKTDWTASKTGNGFVETVSVDTANKSGWAHSSQADYLIYYVPGDALVYIIAFANLRARLHCWHGFPLKRIPNQGYNTLGLLVPLDEFERIATQVISL
jgi:hypothetical protein